jgi:hypothetical protein
MRRWLLTILVALTPAIALAQSPAWPSGSPVALPSIPYVIPGPFINGAGATNGPILATDGTASAPSYAFAANTNRGLFNDTANAGIGLTVAGAQTALFSAGGIFNVNGSYQTSSSGVINWTNGTALGGSADVILLRDAAAVLALKNSTTAQTLRVYGTTTGTKYLSLAHDGTNGVIDTAASSGLLSLAPTNASSVTLGKKITSYNGTTTAGLGVEVVVAAGRATAQTAANASVSTFTVGAADGTFEVSANVLVTTATTHTFTVECAYTDEGNTARTLTLPFTLVAGSAIVTSVANANGTVPYMGITMHIRAKAATAITIRTQAAGTYTTVTYNVEGLIRQIS